MRQREWWKYKDVAAFLRYVGEEHQFEYPMVGVGVFDLALMSKMMLVEFDGSYHETQEQQEADKQKDVGAGSRGWEVVRIQVVQGSVIPASALYSVLLRTNLGVIV